LEPAIEYFSGSRVEREEARRRGVVAWEETCKSGLKFCAEVVFIFSALSKMLRQAMSVIGSLTEHYLQTAKYAELYIH